MATKKMPKAVLAHMKSKPAPAKKGKIPPALAAWHKAHPNGKYAPKKSKGK